MKTIVSCCMALALFAAAPSPGSAGEASAPAPQRAAPKSAPDKGAPAPKADRFMAQVRLGGLYFDNFFQAPEGAPRENVFGATFEGGAAVRLRENAPLEGYVEGDYVVYQRFDPSRALALGVRSESRPHGYDVSVRLLNGRPSREIRDEFDRADVFALEAEYSYRATDDWEIIGFGEYRHETFDLSPDKVNDVASLGGAVRYRGFGSRFSPELGLRLGGRDVKDDNEDLSQREAYLRLRWSPSRTVYLTLRYRRRSRDYSIESPGAANFGRRDTRGQWVLTADWKRGKSLVWNLYYAFQDSDSTRPQGRFKTQMLSLGLTHRF